VVDVQVVIRVLPAAGDVEAVEAGLGALAAEINPDLGAGDEPAQAVETSRLPAAWRMRSSPTWKARRLSRLRR
jgi:hypothetical protein